MRNLKVYGTRIAIRGSPSQEGFCIMKRILLLAALGGLVFTTSLVPADAAPRRAADGTEATTSSTQRSQSTRNRSTSQSQKANRQKRGGTNKANRNRAPRTPPAEG
jgi:hypothetical protein